MTNSGYMKGNDNTLKSKLLQLAHEHFPELYLYEVYYIDEEELFENNETFDYVLLTNNADYTIKDDLGNEYYYVDHKGNKSLSNYAKDNHYDIHVSTYNKYIMVVLPHDVNYEIHYNALKNSELDVVTVEYGRPFSSKLKEYENHIDISACDTGVINLKENKSQTMDVSEYASLLKIDKFLLPWQINITMLLIIVIAAIYGLLVLNQFIYCFIRKYQYKFNRHLLIISIFALSFFEAEFSYWLLPDQIYISIIWKLLSFIAIIAIYLVGKNLKDLIKKPFDYLFIPIVLLCVGNVVSSTHANLATYIIYILAIASLITYMIRAHGVNKNLWPVFATLTVIFLLLAIPLYKRGIGYMLLLFIPEGILLLLLSIDKKMKFVFANYCLIASMILLSINVTEMKYVMSHTLYEVLMYISLLLFAFEKIDVKDNHILEEQNELEEPDELKLELE